MSEPYTPMLTLVIDFHMAESNQLYDVKIFVRSSVKLLEEIKLILEKNANCERYMYLRFLLIVPNDLPYWRSLVTVWAERVLLNHWFSIKEVALVKGDDERIAKLERLVNQIVVNHGKGSSSNDLMSTCSRPDIDNVKVADDGMPTDNADGNHDIRIGLYNASSCSPANIDNGKVIGAGMGIDNFNGKNDIPNENHNAVNQGLGGYANDPMELRSSCSRVDMDNGEVACSGMGIDKVDGMNDIPNLNHNCVNQRKGGSTNDPMSTCSLTDMDNGEVACDGMVIDKADGKNEYTYSQRAPSTLDVLIKALDCANDNPGIDVLQHDNDVDRSVAELNHHPIADIHVEPIHVYDFADDYMSVLNDEEREAKYSLDEMKLMDEEEKLVVKDPSVKQHVDAFIDEQEDKTTMLSVSMGLIETLQLTQASLVQCVACETHSKKTTCCITFDLWVRHNVVILEIPTLMMGPCGVGKFYDTLVMSAKTRRPCGENEENCTQLAVLSRNLPSTVKDPLQTALAYRERILEYFWRHKTEAEPSVLPDEGTYQLIIYDSIATRLQGHTLSYNTSSLDGRKYSSLALEDQSLDHLKTKLYD
ncbi:hypothetical protein Tco_0215461 [Tanacetum coccineum]